MKTRIILLAASALLMGACGNDRDLDVQVERHDTDPSGYVNDGVDTEQTPAAELRNDSREPYEDVVEQGNVDNNLGSSAEETNDALQNPEGGMPEGDGDMDPATPQ